MSTAFRQSGFSTEIMSTSALDIACDISQQVSEQTPEAQIFVLGGIASAALCSAEVDVNNRRLQAPITTTLSTRRQNGTRRDIDLFLLQTDTELAREVAEVATKVSGKHLNVSMSQARLPGQVAAVTSNSKHVHEDDGRMTLRLGPFNAAIPTDALLPWTVQLGEDKYFQLFNPRFHLLSYKLRRLRGEHPKDHTDNKLHRLETVVNGIAELNTPEANASYAELDAMIEDLAAFTGLSITKAMYRYGYSAAKARTATGIAYSSWYTKHFQRREDKRYEMKLKNSK